MGDDLLPELGDLVFSVLIGYAGALQFLYVVRHLYHWSCGHMASTENDVESLKRLQERMRSELAEAEAKELQAGTQVMKDGLLYKDGFRTDAEQLKNDRLRAEQSTPEAREKRKKEIETELKRQKEIEEKTRAQLAEAEAQLEQQRKLAAEELAARQQAEEERAKEAEREEARKLLEREQMRVEEERRREVEEEARRKREAEEEEARRKRDAEEEARRVAEEEAARKRAEEEEIKRQEQEEARKAAEEETQRKHAAEEAEKRRFEEQARKAAEEEEMAQKLAEEEEAQRHREVEALRAAEANAAREAEEQSQKLLEAERQRELEQRKREAEEEAGMAQKIAEENAAQRRVEGNAAKETEEQSRKLLDAERQHELEQRKREAEEEAIGGHIENWTGTNNREEEEDAENERKLFEAEQLHEAEQRVHDVEEAQNEGESESAADEEEEEEIKFNRMYANEALASKKQNELGEAETLDSIMQLLDAESDRQIREKKFEEAAARERGEKQRLIEENARKFLEADQEMEQLLESVQKQRRLSATESAPQSPVFEEPCIRKTMSPLSDNSDSGGGERVTQTVKTQFGQTSSEPYSLTTKPLLFKSISDDAPSLEPHSSLSAQPSDDFEPDAYETLHNTIDVQFTQLERQAPDGEDNDNTSSTQYTDDYLRSLDGIKQRPLVREDGSGRRRAFKKRRSSGSSNSSFESRASREEELKMFTSLEEEELQAKKEGDADFTPIKYSNEQLLKVKAPRRRHKRSPAKDAKPSDRSLRGSLEMLNEEANTNPWGEVAPEHYKDMPFWKHEKSMSIDEETMESELPAAEKEQERDVNARNLPTASAFEEATNTQNEEAITVLQRQKTKEEQETVDVQQQPVSEEPARSDIQPNTNS